MRSSNALPAIARSDVARIDPDRERRAVPDCDARARCARATPGRGGRASQLVDGRQDLGRFGDPDEQGARADRGVTICSACRRERIDIVVHPQSVIHSMVEYRRRLGARPAGQRPTCAFRSLMLWPGPSGWRRRAERLDLAADRPARFRSARPRALPGAAARPRGAGRGRRGAGRPQRRQRGRGRRLPCRRDCVSATSRASSSEALERLRHRGAPRSIGDVLEIDRVTRARGRAMIDGAVPTDARPDPALADPARLLCVLGPLVFIHELGHYLVARWFGVGAETFSIGFGREMFGWTDKRGTRWKVGWLPLGGYVKFVGDMNPASAAERRMARRCRPSSAREPSSSSPVWQRFLVVAGRADGQFPARDPDLRGLLRLIGDAAHANVVGAVVAGQPRRPRPGIEPGDRIVVDRRPRHRRLSPRSSTLRRDPPRRAVQRHGRARRQRAARSSRAWAGTIEERPIRPAVARRPARHRRRAERLRARAGWQALPIGDGLHLEPDRDRWSTAWCRSSRGATLAQGTGRADQDRADRRAEGAALGFLPFIQLIALLSINLGFINLLPVPMLDGGHLAVLCGRGGPAPPAQRARRWNGRSAAGWRCSSR